MKLLNPGYDNNIDKTLDYEAYSAGTLTSVNETEEKLVNNSLWWNSGSGTCYVRDTGLSYNCDFTNLGLSEKAKEFVIDSVWPLGELDYGYNHTPNQLYVNERLGNVVDIDKVVNTLEFDQCFVNTSYDNVRRTTTWTGKVGLPYPSDFGYASDLNACKSTVIGYGRNYNCSGTNWLMKNLNIYWTMTSGIKDHYDAYPVYYETRNFRESYWAQFPGLNNSILPVLTLDPEVISVSGTGTEDDPYVASY